MAKGGFFNNYFYGKAGKKDYTHDDLPKTRLQLFGTVLSVRKGSMIGLNLLYLAFWLPAVFWTFMNVVQLSAPEGISLDSLIYSWLLILFPLIAVTGPFNMGASYVMRNWARDEHSYVWMDFWAGVSANWKQGLIFGLINGAMPLIAYLGWSFYAQMSSQSALFYLPLAIILIMALLWTLCAQILPTMLVTYRLSFPAALKNALLMCMASLPKAAGTLILTLIMPLLLTASFLFFPAALNYLAPIVIVFYAVFGLSFNKLIVASHANMLCEKYLNTKIDGAKVGIGLQSVSETKISEENT